MGWVSDFVDNTVGSITDGIGDPKNFFKNMVNPLTPLMGYLPLAVDPAKTFLKGPVADNMGIGLPPEEAPSPQVAATSAPVMPTQDSEGVRMARRRLAAAFAKRGGRASTVLTGGSDKLGA
jgi:hypothetical protein